MPTPTATASTNPEPRKHTLTVIRAGLPYSAWLKGFAASERSTVPSLFDKAVAEYAAARGYQAPPPRNARD